MTINWLQRRKYDRNSRCRRSREGTVQCIKWRRLDSIFANAKENIKHYFENWKFCNMKRGSRDSCKNADIDAVRFSIFITCSWRRTWNDRNRFSLLRLLTSIIDSALLWIPIWQRLRNKRLTRNASRVRAPAAFLVRWFHERFQKSELAGGGAWLKTRISVPRESVTQVTESCPRDRKKGCGPQLILWLRKRHVIKHVVRHSSQWTSRHVVTFFEVIRNTGARWRVSSLRTHWSAWQKDEATLRSVKDHVTWLIACARYTVGFCHERSCMDLEVTSRAILCRGLTEGYCEVPRSVFWE